MSYERYTAQLNGTVLDGDGASASFESARTRNERNGREEKRLRMLEPNLLSKRGTGPSIFLFLRRRRRRRRERRGRRERRRRVAVWPQRRRGIARAERRRRGAAADLQIIRAQRDLRVTLRARPLSILARFFTSLLLDSVVFVHLWIPLLRVSLRATVKRGVEPRGRVLSRSEGESERGNVEW